MIKEMVSMRSRSRERVRAKGKAREIVTLAVRPGTTQGSVLTRNRAIAKEKVSTESVTTAGKKAIPQESALRAKT